MGRKVPINAAELSRTLPKGDRSREEQWGQPLAGQHLTQPMHVKKKTAAACQAWKRRFVAPGAVSGVTPAYPGMRYQIFHGLNKHY